MIIAARGTRGDMTDDTVEVPKQPQTGHQPWCYDWPQCPECSEIARRYYPSAEQRVAQFFGGSGDSYSSYRAVHDHPWLVIATKNADAWGQMFRSIRRWMRRRT